MADYRVQLGTGENSQVVLVRDERDLSNLCQALLTEGAVHTTKLSPPAGADADQAREPSEAGPMALFANHIVLIEPR